MKRFITLLLLAAMLVSCGSGASEGKDTSADTQTDSASDTETTAAELTDNLPDMDMDGFVLSIYHNDQEQMFWTNLLLDAGIRGW